MPPRNRSPSGWWIASYLLLATKPAKGQRQADRLAWENTVVVEAHSPEAAYQKVVDIGKREADAEWQWGGSDDTVGWVFDGLTSLLPIYEDLQDGAEILWRAHRGASVRIARARVCAKRELEAFDDS